MKKLFVISLVVTAMVAFATVAQAQIGLTDYYGDGDLWLTDGGSATELRIVPGSGVSADTVTVGYNLHVGSARPGKVDGTIWLWGDDDKYLMLLTDWDLTAKFAGSEDRGLVVATDNLGFGLKINEGRAGTTPLVIALDATGLNYMDVRAEILAIPNITHPTTAAEITNIWTAIENIEIALAQKGASGLSRYVDPSR